MGNIINNKIDMFIMASMKNHDTVRTETLRAIKTAFINWKTDKENVGKTLDENAEIQILKRMVKQREESIDQYKSAGRDDLANEESTQVNIIKEYLPAEATAEDIEKAFEQVMTSENLEASKKNMGAFVKGIKALLPTANGKLVAQIVQSKLN